VSVARQYSDIVSLSGLPPKFQGSVESIIQLKGKEVQKRAATLHFSEIAVEE
jgi:hypothetical protein